VRPPNTHDKDFRRAMELAEECESRAEWFPDNSYYHGLRDQWLNHAVALPTLRSQHEGAGR
jgi:hypothetical protein